ncbi:translocation/assembly module TamB domain-containing protein [Alteriqipengyuania sp. NZ-12B]|uniref:Translocation/assembly module TamB domain-containing protein n=1 Tax=Alteriqipengyuania abyssalis TaxID=2860200 RepID=A0ABS7PEC8_9SPHN|nr:translocation/assembly module TamB domain-containing protein [Alteriqipengyuania abyssalis]MBY8337429.1 translocation/assembly module TamB domain-containing protein [Alteriqipengyuania abyssalis]
MSEEAIREEATADAPRRKSATARIAKWAVGIVVVLALLGAALVAGLNSPIGKRWIVDQVAKIEPKSGLRISIGRIEGSIYSDLVLHDLSLADPQGVFLTVPEVDLDWNPFAWLSSGLDIDSVEARRGELKRLPKLNPGDPDSPMLPGFDIRIDQLELVDWTLAPGVAGDARRQVNLVGSADIRNGRAMVKANGRFGEGDRLVLDLTAEPDGDLFDVDMRVDAPAGGVITSLANLDGDYVGRIDGDGTWKDWSGDMLLNRNGESLARFRLSAKNGKYGIVGRADTTPFLTGIPQRALGRDTRIEAAGTFADRVLDGKVELIGQGLSLIAEGGANLADNRADGITFEAAVRDPRLFGENLQLVGAQASGTIDGPFRDLTIPFKLVAQRFDAGSATITNIAQEGTATYDGSRWVIPIDARVGRIETGNALADPRLIGGTANGRLVFTGRELVSDSIRINFPDASAQLSLNGNLAENRWQVRGPVAVNGLTFEQIGRVNAGGSIDFLYNGAWRLTADVRGQVPRVTNDTLVNLAGPVIDFSGGVSLAQNAPIDFRQVRLDSRKLNMVLDGQVAPGTTRVAGRGRQAQYGPFTVEASLTDRGPEAVLVFAEPLPAAGLRDVRVALSPIDEGFRIETEGDSTLGRFEGTLGLFSPPGGPTRLAVETLTVSETSVTGDLTLGGGAASGTLALTGGGLDGTIMLAPRSGGQGFDVALAARNARFGGATALEIAQADIDMSGQIADGDTTVQGTASAQGIVYGNLFIGRMTADARLVNGRGDVNAAIAGRRGRGFALQLAADIAPDRIALATRGNLAGRELTMPRRAVLTKIDGGGWALQRSQISYGDGFVIAEGRMGGEATRFDLNVRDIPLSLADIVMGDAGLGGSLSGTITYAAPKDGLPTGEARVRVDKFTRSGVILASRPVDLSLVARLETDRLQARAILDDNGTEGGRVQALISDLPRNGSLFERLQAGDLFGQLRYRGPAQSLWRLAAIDLFDFSGPVAVAADIRGTLADPRVRGSLSSDNLRVQSSVSGTDIRDARVRGAFAGSRLQITEFRGTAPNGGVVNGSGVVDLANLGPGRGPEIDIRAAAQKAQLINARGLQATVTGPLRIVSNGSGGTIAGRLLVEKASWRLGNGAQTASIPTITTREINLPRDRYQPSAPGAPWRFLVDARAPSRVDVDGMGLDSEWSADVRVRGTTQEMRIGGEANLIRGDYTFAGARFEVTRGRIEFDETRAIDPRLDIVAETDNNGIDVTVSVQGNAQQPEITFSSNPSLPEEEILSRLLFGGSITSLSATDALQLGAAVASLRGGGGLDPINQLRSAIGLDRLRIVSADPVLDRGTSIALGKNIGRRFYIELITDGRGYSATDAEFRITSWLSLLATVSTVGRNSVSVEASRDY